MAGTTATKAPRKPRATSQRAGRTTAAARKTVAPGVEHTEEALPDVPGGALDLVDEEVPEVARDVLFRRNGVAYTVPVTFFAADTLRYLDLIAWQGSDVAIAWAMRRALGDVGVEALMSVKNMSDEKMTKLVAVVHSRLTGIDLPKA